MNRNEEFKSILKERLTEKRYIHSVNVADAAVALAERYGADAEKAYTTGLIHDCCKDMPPALQLQYMLENGVELGDYELSSVKLFHAICGSAFAEKELGVTDEDMLNAIRYHTTGRKGMSLLEKVVFIADFIGIERDYEDVEVMREKALISLEDAIVYGLGFTIQDLVKKGAVIHPDTVDAYNEARLILMKREKTGE